MARSKKNRDALTYDTLPALFTGICDAIRTKTGGTDPIAHQDIPSSIANLPSGGSELDLPNVTAESAVTTYTNPITYTATADGLLIIYTGESHTDSRATGVTINGETATFGTIALYEWFNMGHALTFVYVKSGDVVSATYGASRKYQLLFIPY